MYGHCLLDLNDILADQQYGLSTMEGFRVVFPADDTRGAGNPDARQANTFQRMHDQLYADAVDADDPNLLPFNESQAVVYNTIRDAALEEDPALGPRSSPASFIKRVKIIIWDECSMVSKNLIETVNRSFQDIMGNTASFGGLLMVFGGDFRQVLPIIRGASRSMIVSQCLNRASFWNHVVQLQLTVNMRVQQATQSNNPRLASSLQQFADYLLQVDRGGDDPTAVLPTDLPSSLIAITITPVILKATSLCLKMSSTRSRVVPCRHTSWS